MPDTEHIPVLSEEVLSHFPTHALHAVDGTLGYGGHAERVLHAFPRLLLVGIDKDAAAIAAAKNRLQRTAARVTYIHGSYEHIPDILAEEGVKKTDAILLDLGFSSPQIDEPDRGLSFSHEGPLDMRFDTSQGLTGAELLNTASQQELIHILRSYGEEPHAKDIAHEIVLKRKTKPFHVTSELAETVLAVYRKKLKSTKDIPWIGGAHPATRTFQAIRIAVNDELETLKRTLPRLVQTLNPRGRLLIITFHSLEDTIVKHFFKHEARSCLCPPELPKCVCGHEAQIRIITKKGITPSQKEKKINPRSRSARLRVAEKM